MLRIYLRISKTYPFVEALVTGSRHSHRQGNGQVEGVVRGLVLHYGLEDELQFSH